MADHSRNSACRSPSPVPPSHLLAGVIRYSSDDRTGHLGARVRASAARLDAPHHLLVPSDWAQSTAHAWHTAAQVRETCAMNRDPRCMKAATGPQIAVFTNCLTGEGIADVVAAIVRGVLFDVSPSRV